MTDMKDNVKTEGLNLSNQENVFTKEVKPINPFNYFLMSAGNAILKGILWIADFVLSMVLSLIHFIWMGILGIGKIGVGIFNFIKRKCHQFIHNDLYGRLSFIVFGASSFKHGQIANGIMYILFEVGYIILFALFGAPAIGSIGPLGPVNIREEIEFDPVYGEVINKYYDGSSILSLLGGIVAILSIFFFLYIWYRSIESGYALYRISKFPEYRDLTSKVKDYSNELSDGCFAAFENGINKRKYKASVQADVNAYISRFEDKKEKKYVCYLLNGTFDNAYKYLKENKKLNNKRDNLSKKLDEILVKREAKYATLTNFDSTNKTDDEISKNSIARDKFNSKTIEIKSKRNRKIQKLTNEIRELTKRYSSFAEVQNTINNDKYGKFNFYFKHIADIEDDILFWTNYESLLDIYTKNLDKSEDKNNENEELSKHILTEFGEKRERINQKYDAIIARRGEVEAEIAQAKADYDLKVKSIKELGSATMDAELVEAKTQLVEITTKLNRKLYDLPSVKTVKAMRKEELSEAKHAATRDRRYLKTNFTAESYAIECVIDEMVVNLKFEYKNAKYFASLLFKDAKTKETYSTSEVNEKISELKNKKASFIDKYPSKYVGKPKEFKNQLKGLLNENFHITILALPIIGILIITVIPLIFSILIAFTDFSNSNGTLPPEQIHWIGLGNFHAIFDPSNKMFGDLANELGATVSWTFIWAICATFSNYFLGIIVALMINKDGIKFKKFWRTIFVLTIAIPQFISLLSISRLLSENGALDVLVKEMNGVGLGFAADHNHVLMTKIIVILVNIWVGIPYTILSTTGILLNIPKDLYESSRVDGAGPITQFFKITMPYILFVTGPYLITQFIGNFNNFNVIFFLTGGRPTIMNSKLGVGETDLLITFLYNVIQGKQEYGIASTVGIFIFAICAFFSIVMYNKSGAIQQEDQFQ